MRKKKQLPKTKQYTQKKQKLLVTCTLFVLNLNYKNKLLTFSPGGDNFIGPKLLGMTPSPLIPKIITQKIRCRAFSRHFICRYFIIIL